MIKAKYEMEKVFIIVIGANSGIGQALIKQLVGAGASVFGIDIQNDSKVATSKEYQYFTANPLDKDDLINVIQNIQGTTTQINGLVNLSGTIAQFKSITTISFEEWNETYDISFKSCFNACKAFIPLMENSSNPSIVNMSSGLAFIGQKKYGPYSAAKAAVISFSKTLAAELAPEIRVNTVAPGAVDTNFIYKDDGTTRFDKEVYKRLVPLGTMAKAEEIGSVILFLLSDAASHITGQCIHVNGGAGMH